jgi:hypothetical protein
MTGYFSRLMKQSGIAVGPPIDPGSEDLAQHPNRSEERDVVAPTHAGQQELVESRGDELISEPQKGSETDSDISGPIVEEQNPTEPVLHGEAYEVPRHHSDGQYHRQSRLSERRKLDARDSERTLPWRGEDIRELSEEAVEGATLRADERSSPSIEASREVLAFRPGEEPQDQTSPQRVWQNTLREVREWVTGSPMADDEDAENRDVSRARGTTGITTDSPFVEERGAASHPKPTAPSPREAQDLRLEIGTISVTVEEPQKEIPESDRRTKTAEKKAAGHSERSRLSRHYVRVR